MRITRRVRRKAVGGRRSRRGGKVAKGVRSRRGGGGYLGGLDDDLRQAGADGPTG